MFKVRAIRRGYYKDRRWIEGQEFIVDKESELSLDREHGKINLEGWMEVIEDLSEPEPVAKVTKKKVTKKAKPQTSKQEVI